MSSEITKAARARLGMSTSSKVGTGTSSKPTTPDSARDVGSKVGLKRSAELKSTSQDMKRKPAGTPAVHVTKTSKPAAYHIESYPERMPRARAEMARLGGVLDALLSESRVSATELRRLEKSGQMFTSFRPEYVTPDEQVSTTIDRDQTEMAFDAILTEMIHQSVIKLDRLGAAQRQRVSMVEAQAESANKKLDKYKTVAFAATEENKQYCDELATPPYQSMTIPQIKSNLKEFQYAKKKLEHDLKYERGRREASEKELLTAKFELNRAKDYIADLTKEASVPQRVFNFVSDQLADLQTESQTLRQKAAELEACREALHEQRAKMQQMETDTYALRFHIFELESKQELVRKEASKEVSFMRWKICCRLMNADSNAMDDSIPGSKTQHVLPFLSLKLPQPIVIKKKPKGFEPVDVDELLATISNVIHQKAILDFQAANNYQKTPMPTFFREKLSASYAGNPKEAKQQFQSIIHSMNFHLHANKIVELFAIMCGIHRPDVYAPHISHVCIEFLQRLYHSDLNQLPVALQANSEIPLREIMTALCGPSGVSANPNGWNFRFLKQLAGNVHELQELAKTIEVLSRPYEMVKIHDLVGCFLHYLVQRTCDTHAELQKLFKDLDTDSSGTLSFEEFQNIVVSECFNMPLEVQELKDMYLEMHKLDDDPEHLMDPSIFSAILIRKGILPRNRLSDDASTDGSRKGEATEPSVAMSMGMGVAMGSSLKSMRGLMASKNQAKSRARERSRSSSREDEDEEDQGNADTSPSKSVKSAKSPLPLKTAPKPVPAAGPNQTYGGEKSTVGNRKTKLGVQQIGAKGATFT